MRNRKIVYVLFFLFTLALISMRIEAAVCDTWAAVPKILKGDFFSPGGDWTDTNMSDTADVDGYRYIELNLIPGTRFEYKFKADNVDEDRSNRVFVVPSSDTILTHNWDDTPLAPINLRAYSDNEKITLTWDTPANSISWLDVVRGGGFNVYMCTGSVFTGWSKVNVNISIPQMKYTISGLKNDSTYFFAVTAYDAYGVNSLESLKSDSITAIPKSVVSVVFRINSYGIQADTFYLGYDTGVWQTMNMLKEATGNIWNCTVFLNAGLTAQYKFFYKYSTNDNVYEYSNNSDYIFAYPDTGTSIREIRVEGMAVGSNWGIISNLVKYPDGFWRGSANLLNKHYEYKIVLNGSQYINDPLNPNTQNNNSIIFNKRFENNDARRTLNVPVASNYIVTCDWEDTPMASPANFIATVIDKSAVKLSWNKPAAIEDADSVLIEYTETPGNSNSWIKLTSIDAAIDTYIHTNLIPTDTYYYRIYCIDYSGNTSSIGNLTLQIILSKLFTGCLH